MDHLMDATRYALNSIVAPAQFISKATVQYFD